MENFWDGFEKRAMEKEAILGGLAAGFKGLATGAAMLASTGAHAGQSVMHHVAPTVQHMSQSIQKGTQNLMKSAPKSQQALKVAPQMNRAKLNPAQRLNPAQTQRLNSPMPNVTLNEQEMKMPNRNFAMRAAMHRTFAGQGR